MKHEKSNLAKSNIISNVFLCNDTCFLHISLVLNQHKIVTLVNVVSGGLVNIPLSPSV